MQCGKCREEAVIFQQYAGKHLCRRHFIADVEAKAKHAIRRHGWIKAGDYIGVPLAGDTRSAALLALLFGIFGERRDIRIIALIDEGMITARDCSKRHAESLGIPVIGFAPEPNSDTGKRSLFTPERTRPGLMNFVRDEGITKIAWSTCLDDVAIWTLTNILTANVGRFFIRPDKMAGSPLTTAIRPFIAVPGAEVDRYARLLALECEDPITGQRDAFGREIEAMVEEYTKRHPATKYSLMHLCENIRNSGIEIPVSGSPLGV